MANGRTHGFTMVEVIVIIVVAGFLGVLTLNLMGTQMLRSASPLRATADTARAETAMEAVVAYYTQAVNSGSSGALDAVQAQYPNNATFTATRGTFNGVDALTVTVTEGGASLTNILTQARTSSADNATNF